MDELVGFYNVAEGVDCPVGAESSKIFQVDLNLYGAKILLTWRRALTAR